MYGEVHTDFKLINDMFEMIPNSYFKNPNLTWLDPCAGKGYFSIILYKKLFKDYQKSLLTLILDITISLLK